MFQIIQKKDIAEQTSLFVMLAPEIAKKARPGQFVIIRLSEDGERIPLTIADMDENKGTITLIVQAIGYSTKIMCALKEGENILDIAGPLGTPSHIEKIGTFVGIGGGIGIAAVYPVIKGFKKIGVNTVSIIGGRTNKHLFWEDKVQETSNKLFITTDDGSKGEKGLVTAPLKRMIDSGEKIDLVFAVGPTVMMRAVAETTRPYKIPTVVSLNPIMIDATGMCGCCRVCVCGETKFACVDGPDFNAHDVDFNLLLSRQKMYKEQEQKI